MKYLVIFTILLHVTYVCDSKKPISSRIVGGKETLEHQYPWQAFLLVSTNDQTFQCSGSLFASRWILTAAHCVTFSGTTVSNLQVKVFLGVHDLNDLSSHVQHGIRKITVHKDYRHDYLTNVEYYDIALIELSQEVAPSKKIQNATLSVSEPSPNTICYVSGWGKTGFSPNSNVLRRVSVPIISDSKCRQKYTDSWIKGHMLCAGYDNGGKDSCQGDSGGPLQCIISGSTNVVGIVSWGAGCAKPDKPGVYASVPHFRVWIEETMKGLLSSAGGKEEEGETSSIGLNTAAKIIIGFVFGSIILSVIVIGAVFLIKKYKSGKRRVDPSNTQPQQQSQLPSQYQTQYQNGLQHPLAYTNESMNFQPSPLYQNQNNFKRPIQQANAPNNLYQTPQSHLYPHN
ncbi:DgyrCDS12813 [Dimorphilus gyrociliatus]|uniref:DgyrCDS12813 n=1 Tax=Dimorphilus gyrociliatus TaxID=2664684 RepID=A0A7I8W8T1_9ANNE|nr:DgyrCDS12813 [Dimorphilus gyrociliatus]